MNPTLDRRRLLRLVGLSAAAMLVPTKLLAQASDPMSREAVHFDPDAPVLGNPNGSLTLVEFFDYQCPYCKREHPNVARLVAEDGDIRHVMKDWPIFGPPSLRASRLTLAAGPQGHRRGQDALMRTQGRLTDAMVDETLRGAGLDPRALQTAYDGDASRIEALLARNNAQAEGFGLPGTPAYVIGTVLFPGVVTPDDMRAAVSQQR